MKLLFSNYRGDCSYSFQWSSELSSTTVTASLCLAEYSHRRLLLSGLLKNFLHLQLHDSIVFELKNATISKGMVNCSPRDFASGDTSQTKIGQYPLAQNQYMQETLLEEFVSARLLVGPVLALAQNTGKYSWDLFLKYVFAPWPCPYVWI